MCGRDDSERAGDGREVVHGGLVYVSGTVPTNWQATDDVTAQTVDILKQIDAVRSFALSGTLRGRRTN